MIIEQTLYGYNKGHGLLASSFPVRPNNDSSLMSVLSDWTGFRNELGEDSYMTFYPLSNGEKYALPKHGMPMKWNAQGVFGPIL